MSDGMYTPESTQSLTSDITESQSLSSVVGISDWTKQVRRNIQSVARHVSSVLISGPNGTGKEILARAIHAQSPRRDRPFIPVDCAAFVGELFPSHMFGHVKGAFTGAHYDSLGCIRAADGGTLFLDEIGELELPLQAKLLRVLQERVVVPVGGVAGSPVDIRLICATNRDLQSAVKRGTFRQYLYYRLNVVQMRTAALKDRTADIGVLAEHFLATMAFETGVPRKTLTLPAQVLLTAYPWPGNVRQLRNILERAVVFTDCDEIEASLLARLLSEEQSSHEDSFSASILSETETLPTASRRAVFAEAEHGETSLEEPWISLAEHERSHILRALEHTEFNQTEAARLLQTTSRILAGKIKRYAIDITRSRRGRPAKSTPQQPR